MTPGTEEEEEEEEKEEEQKMMKGKKGWVGFKWEAIGVREI